MCFDRFEASKASTSGSKASGPSSNTEE